MLKITLQNDTLIIHCEYYKYFLFGYLSFYIFYAKNNITGKNVTIALT